VNGEHRGGGVGVEWRMRSMLRADNQTGRAKSTVERADKAAERGRSTNAGFFF